MFPHEVVENRLARGYPPSSRAAQGVLLFSKDSPWTKAGLSNAEGDRLSLKSDVVIFHGREEETELPLLNTQHEEDRTWTGFPRWLRVPLSLSYTV